MDSPVINAIPSGVLYTDDNSNVAKRVVMGSRPSGIYSADGATLVLNGSGTRIFVKSVTVSYVGETSGVLTIEDSEVTNVIQFHGQLSINLNHEFPTGNVSFALTPATDGTILVSVDYYGPKPNPGVIGGD